MASTPPTVDVVCISTFDPPLIVVTVLGAPVINLPKPVYDQVREVLGLPDVVCEGRTVGD